MDNNNQVEQINIDNIIGTIIDNRILELLKLINSKYPDKFTKEELNKEYKLIKNNIQLIKNVDDKIIHYKQKRKKCLIEPQNLCCARVWDNIYDRKTHIDVSDIDKQFKVKTYIDINVIKFNDKYIVGSQCARKKTDNSIYCRQHTLNQTHGNYFEIPTQEICFHYLKEGNYL